MALRCVGDTAGREFQTHISQTHICEYSQLHDKVEVGFTLEDIFKRYDVGVFDPVRKEREGEGQIEKKKKENETIQ